MNYNLATETRDFARIDKLNALNDPATFWDDVRKLTSGVKSTHGIRAWQILADIRYNELTGRPVVEW